MLEIILNKRHNKFQRDAVDVETKEYIIKTSGVFLGINTITQNIDEILWSEYTKLGETFVKNLRGSFFVYLHDKKQNKQLVYTNHIGDQRVYYYNISGISIVSDSISSIINKCKTINKNYSLNIEAAYSILTLGYQTGHNTLINEINRLTAGNYIKFEKDIFSISNYYYINNTPNKNISEKEAIEGIDYYFKQAITREFEKDVDYGYLHIGSLSGGLDCRMTNWVANELGYKNIFSFTFSQSGYQDELIARQIAKELNHSMIFTALDGGDFLTRVDDVIKLNEGLTTYSGQAHGKFAIDKVDFKKLGLMHTGNLGDVIIGSYVKDFDYKKPYIAKATSTQLIHKLPKENLKEFKNQEEYLLNIRGFNGILTGNVPIQEHTEVASPFLDIDFLNFALSLPLSMRVNHNIYRKWIINKYPKAANYPWESIGAKITAKTININGKCVPIKKVPSFIITGMKLRLGLAKGNALLSPQHMNPFDYWYKTNIKLPIFFKEYFDNHIQLIQDEEMKNDCIDLFKGTTVEKMQVLSLLASIKLLFS